MVGVDRDGRLVLLVLRERPRSGCRLSPMRRQGIARWRFPVGRRRLRQLQQSPEWTTVEASLLLSLLGGAVQSSDASSSSVRCAAQRKNNSSASPQDLGGGCDHEGRGRSWSHCSGTTRSPRSSAASCVTAARVCGSCARSDRPELVRPAEAPPSASYGRSRDWQRPRGQLDPIRPAPAGPDPTARTSAAACTSPAGTGVARRVRPRMPVAP